MEQPHVRSIKIFISHSSKDEELGSLFKDLFLKAFPQIKNQQIRFSSSDATAVSFGEDIEDVLREDILGAPAFVPIVTPAFLKSEWCKAELYARWGVNRNIFMIKQVETDEPHLKIIENRLHILTLKKKRETTSGTIEKFLHDMATKCDFGIPQPFYEYNDTVIKIMEYQPEEDNNRKYKFIKDFNGVPFLNTYGLNPDKVRDDGVLQNFYLSSSNLSPIQYLWADSAVGNKISAKTDIERAVLRIEFEYNGEYGCNFAIRLQDQMAVLRNEYRFISFEARVIKGVNGYQLERVGLGIRVVNGFMQHWTLCKNANDPEYLCIDSGEFKQESPICIDILEHKHWRIFSADGTVNRGPEKPDFSLITSVVVSMSGIDNLGRTLIPGKGIIEIKNMKLIK